MFPVSGLMLMLQLEFGLIGSTSWMTLIVSDLPMALVAIG